jgi:transcriptional regulator with PAS, ATPase and Fis domain
MADYSWPGNVRQLIKVIQGSAALVPDGGWLDLIQLEMRLPGITESRKSGSKAKARKGETLHDVMHRAERDFIQDALVAQEWNITRILFCTPSRPAISIAANAR